MGAGTEIYCIWAFGILFYTHWEIVFVAASIAAEIAAGLVFTVGLTRLGVSYDKKAMVKIAGKRGLALAWVLAVFPIAFIARIALLIELIAAYIPALLLIAVLIITPKRIYDKIK